MRYSKIAILFLLGLISLSGIAQHQKLSMEMLSLDSVLGRIERNNTMLKMYDEQINAINNYSDGAKSWMAPTLSSGPWQTPYSNFRDGMWMTTAQQMIPNPTKQKANFEYMRAMAPVEMQGKAAKKNEMFSMAKQNYYNCIILKKKEAVLVQSDSILSYILKVAQIRYSYNKEKLNYIFKTQADLYELRNMQTMLRSEMKMNLQEINTLMNRNPSEIFEIDTNLQSHQYELKMADTSLISSKRSDIRQFDAGIDLLKLQQEYEKSKRQPDFGVSVSHMQSLNTMPSSFAAMGMITIPIAPWASKEYKSTIKGIDNRTQAISFQKQSLINETLGKIAILQTQIESVKIQLLNYNQNIIPSYYKSYQSSLLAYEQNMEELFMVLDGLKMYRMAKVNQLNQQAELLKLEVAYEKEMEIR